MYDVTHMWNLKQNTNELNYEIETNSQTQRTELWLPGEEWGEGGMDGEFRGSKFKWLQNGQITRSNCVTQGTVLNIL